MIARFSLMTAAALALTLALNSSAPASADDREYDIRVEAPATIQKGTTGEISVTLAPRAKRRLSDDGPLRIAVAIAPGEGLTLSSRLFRRRDAVDAKAEALRFKIGAKAEATGSYEIDLDIRFWICGARTCRPVREKRRVEVTVSDPVAKPSPETPETSS